MVRSRERMLAKWRDLEGMALEIGVGVWRKHSRVRRLGLERKDVEQEARVALWEGLGRFDWDERLAAKIYTWVWGWVVQRIIYDGDIVRWPYWVHWERWKAGESEKRPFVKYVSVETVELEDEKAEKVEDESECAEIVREWIEKRSGLRLGERGRRRVERYCRVLEEKIKYATDGDCKGLAKEQLCSSRDRRMFREWVLEHRAEIQEWLRKRRIR